MQEIKRKTGPVPVQGIKNESEFCCMSLIDVQKQLILITQNIDNLVSVVNGLEKSVEGHNTYINQIQATEMKKKVDELYELKCKGEGGFKVAYVLLANFFSLIIIALKVFKVL